MCALCRVYCGPCIRKLCGQAELERVSLLYVMRVCVCVYVGVYVCVCGCGCGCIHTCGLNVGVDVVVYMHVYVCLSASVCCAWVSVAMV